MIKLDISATCLKKFTKKDYQPFVSITQKRFANITEGAQVWIEKGLQKCFRKMAGSRDGRNFASGRHYIQEKEDWENESQEYTSCPKTYYPSQRRRNVKKNKNFRVKSEGEKSHHGNVRGDNSTTITVFSKQVGKVIGKGGSKIRELQSTTKTNITIGKENEDGNVSITIYGPEESREQCKEMIEELTQDEKSKFQPSWSIPPPVDDSLRGITKTDDSFYEVDWDAVNKNFEEYEKLRWSRLTPLKKDFYVEDPAVAAMTDEYVRKLRKSMNNITVRNPFGGNGTIPKPVETFEQAFSSYPEILHEIEKQGFEKPFPIQCQAWPILLSGKDMIGVAQTGTGKTLAFLLPALIHTDGQDTPLSERGGPNVLVIAPTRELAIQIDKEVRKYSYRNIKSVCVYGGGNRQEQIKEISEGVQIVIATPGRLNDLVHSNVINIDAITFLVLDEADRMLDMGFEPQIRRIMLDIRPDKQTVMTSATWPHLVQTLAQKYMKEPVQVVVGSLDLAAVHSVKQTIEIIDENDKFDYLVDLISKLSADDKIIVFVDKKITADSLSCELILRRVDCQSIHGNRDQADREQALEDLRSGATQILIATDVASRGIDIEDVTKVVNYDFPRNIEEYVHRVGRTGRAGKTGEAITLFTVANAPSAKELISILQEAEQEVPPGLMQLKSKHDSFLEKKKSENVSYQEEAAKAVYTTNDSETT